MSRWHGKKVSLKKFRGTQQKYEKEIGHFGTNIRHIINRGCLWENIPRAVAMSFRLKNQILINNPKPDENIHSMFDLNKMNFLSYDLSKNGYNCSNPEITLREYLQ